MIVAQGERSAALGYGPKMNSSFVPSGWQRLWRCQPEGKKEVGWAGFSPRAAASRLHCAAARQAAALPWANIFVPLRGAGKANQPLEPTAASLFVSCPDRQLAAPRLRRRSVSSGCRSAPRSCLLFAALAPLRAVVIKPDSFSGCCQKLLPKLFAAQAPIATPRPRPNHYCFYCELGV